MPPHRGVSDDSDRAHTLVELRIARMNRLYAARFNMDDQIARSRNVVDAPADRTAAPASPRIETADHPGAAAVKTESS